MNNKKMDPHSSAAENCSPLASIGGAASSVGAAMAVSSSHEGSTDALSVGAAGVSSVATGYHPGLTEASSVRCLLQRSHAFSGGEENDDNGSMEMSTTDPRPDNFLQVCARTLLHVMDVCGITFRSLPFNTPTITIPLDFIDLE